MPAVPLAELAVAAAEGLSGRFGSEAAITAAAPGRVNLIGEHIDYCDGFVLPIAIDRAVVIAAAPRDGHRARIGSAAGGTVEIALDGAVTPAEPAWANYVRGVIRGFQDRGLVIPGFDAWIVSSVPMGAGLSSSAALECAAATLLERLVGTTLSSHDKALLCQRAEHDFAGVPCGIMDQFASVFGQADTVVLIDCRSCQARLVPFADPAITVLVADTKIRHELSAGGYAERRQAVEQGLRMLGRQSWRDVTAAELEAEWDRLGDPIDRRCRHVVGEIARTAAAAAALEAGDVESLGELMAASHDSLRDDFEVSCAELDVLVESARRIGRVGGVIGARMTGGGFGGSTVTLCESRRAAAIATRLRDDYRAATGIELDIFATRPAAGARVL